MSNKNESVKGERFAVLVPYSYERDNETKTRWTRVGTAFTSNDESGINIELRPGLAVSGRVIVRPVEAGGGADEAGSLDDDDLI